MVLHFHLGYTWCITVHPSRVNDTKIIEARERNVNMHIPYIETVSVFSKKRKG